MTKNRVGRACVFLFAWILAATLQLHAQTLPSSLTPEQLQMFQSLSPAQQQQVLSAIKSSGGTAGLSSQAGQAAGNTQGQPGAGLGPTNVQRSLAGQVPQGPPRMKPSSVLLLSVDIASVCDQSAQGQQTPAQTQCASISPAVADRLLGAQGGLIDGEPIDSPDVQEKLRTLLEDRRQQVLDANPYTLNGIGQLSLPTLPPITLWGLTEKEATALLNANPELAGLRFRVSILPVVNIGTTALKPFGYDLFSSEQSSFSAPAEAPVPTDYVVGPGDTVDLELYGKQVGNYALAVDRDGNIHIPGLGPLEVAGLRYDQIKSRIEQRIQTEMFGVQASVTMGTLRTIRIFVTGDVSYPSSYQVSSLSTVTNALYAAGGISKIGSLRNVEIKRQDRLLGKLDLYALLLHGDSFGDVKLQQGDVVFVPPVGPTASIGGEVRRPAIYEVRTGDTVGDLLSLAGGLAPDADPHAARLERVDGGVELTVLDLDLDSSRDLARRLQPGDILTVPQILDEMADSVSLQGQVLRPGVYSWHPGMHLTELLTSLSALKEDADQRYVLIRRESYPSRRVDRK